jgi:putative ABC transport system permease protein
MEHDYLIRYNTVPLSDKEETYTYIDINGSKIKGIKTGDGAKIMGIKQNSDYVDLMHNKNNINNLLFKLPEHINEQTQFPVIINAYAQKKYGLSVGSTFTVNLANNSQRFDREIRGLDPLTANFKVVGVCDTYIGEEYYTSQDVANYVLDLKNNLGPIATEPSVTPHEYYPDMDKALQTATQDKTALAADSAKNNDLSAFPDPTDGLKTSKSPGVTYDTTDLYDLNNAQVQSVGTNITPYGFNGVFTKNSNGSQLLSNGVSLYSPSGLYPGNDRMNKDTLEGLLRYGANLQIASQIMGL